MTWQESGSAPPTFRLDFPSDCRSYEDFGESVGPSAADVALGGVERNVVDGLLALLAVSRELLHARLAL